MNPRRQHTATNKSRKSFMKGVQVYIYKVYNPIKSYSENPRQLYPIRHSKNSQKRKKHYNPATKSRKKSEKAKKNALIKSIHIVKPLSKLPMEASIKTDKVSEKVKKKGVKDLEGKQKGRTFASLFQKTERQRDH